MASKKLIAIDLDGTLLNTQKQISPETREIIADLQAQGHQIVIATGRPFRSSEAIYHSLNLQTPIVNFNGALVHHPLDSDWGVYHDTLPLATVRQIIESCQAYDVKNMIAEITDDIYIQQPDELLMAEFDIGDPQFHIGALQTHLQDDPTSLLIQPAAENANHMRSMLSETFPEGIEHRSWGVPWRLVEVVKGGVNKAVGLQRIAESFNIARQDIIAFGDEDNDLEMLTYAGEGVAMGNAIDLLKQHADVTTASNDNDGIQQYLQQRFQLSSIPLESEADS